MSTKKAVLRSVSGLAFVAVADSRHAVVLDSSMDGEPTSGASPLEMLLISLGGCTASDVVSILRKKRVNVTQLEVNVTGERRDEHPRVFTKILVEFVVYGRDIRPIDVDRAIELSSTKYCSVSAMLRSGGVDLSYSKRVVEEASEES